MNEKDSCEAVEKKLTDSTWHHIEMRKIRYKAEKMVYQYIVWVLEENKKERKSEEVTYEFRILS